MYVMSIQAYLYKDDDFKYFYFASPFKIDLDFYKSEFLSKHSGEYDRIDYVIYFYPYSDRRFVCRGVLYE